MCTAPAPPRMPASAAQYDARRDLLAVARARDRAAFARLFDHFAPRVKAYLLRRGLDDGAADDAAQEAMLAVWRRAPTYDPARAAPSTWIFAIARHKCIDMLRAAAARPALDAAPMPPLADPGAGPDDAVLEAQAREAVAGAMEGLEPELADILRLSFFEGLPHAAIAARTGLPLGTVKSRIRRALAALKPVGALREVL
jgi:RNA polymerase sigma-70 factor, ECF subfamily